LVAVGLVVLQPVATLRAGGRLKTVVLASCSAGTATAFGAGLSGQKIFSKD
jgi:hypothetical protein